MSLNVQIVCCNPFQLQNHNKTRGLQPPSKKTAATHPWLTTDHLICVACRKRLSAQQSGSAEVEMSQLSDSGDSDTEMADPMYTPRPTASRKQGISNAVPPTAAQETIVYQKLVVPEGMRSMYWQHFAFPANHNGEVVSRTKVVCTICMTTRSYAGNTTNLRMHLKKSHPVQLQNLEDNPPVPKQTQQSKSHTRKPKTGPVHCLEVSGTLSVDKYKGRPRGGNSSVVVEDKQVAGRKEATVSDNVEAMTSNLFANTPAAKTRRKTLDVSADTLQLMTSELLSPELIQSPGFISFADKLHPGVTLPSLQQMKGELIPSKYDELRNIILCEISTVGEISLSIEEWTGFDNQILVTISANYLQENELVNRVLNTLQLNEINTSSINETFANWGLLEDHVVAIVVATQNTTLLDSLQQWATSIPCFQYTIQQAVEAIFRLSNVEAVLWKCRAIISKYTNFSIKINEIKTDYSKIWTSTYEMLKSMFDIKTDVDLITISDEVKLSFFDWEIIETLLDILSPFQVTIQTLQEENPGLSSIIKPLYWQLITNYLQLKNDEVEFRYTVKSLLKSKLLSAYNNQNNNLLLQTATTLDPRFKQVSFSTTDETSVVEQNIKAMLAQFSNLPVLPVPTPTKKVTGMEMLLGGVKKEMPPKDRADFELSQYTSESPIAFDQSPLLWWKGAELRYPTLFRLARTFMCITACAIPTSKMPREQREKFERQRVSLSLDVVDKLIFLNGNFA